MRRREFVTLLGAAAGCSLLLPALARAQQRPVIGYLSGRSANESRYLITTFVNGLRDQGFSQDQNVTIESEWADGQYDRLPKQAENLVRRGVALIAASGAVQAIRAAKAATQTIPIVFVTGDDPVQLGLVASLNRPGGNITGVNPINQELEAKRLSILHEIAPKATAIALMLNPNSPSADAQAQQAQAAAGTLGRQLYVLKAASAAEIDRAFAVMAERNAGALMIGGDPFYNSRRDQIIALAARHRIPAVYWTREIAAAGGLMTYGANIPDSFRQAGVYAGRILKGEKPGEIPVMRASKFELVINLKTAKALGLDVPDRLMALADEVIE